MKKTNDQYPLLVNEDAAGFNEAVQQLEGRVSPYIKTVKELYNSLQLPEPFNDSVYADIVSKQSAALKASAEAKIKSIPTIIGMNHSQSIIDGRKAVATILSQIEIQTGLLHEAYNRTGFKGRCFPLTSVINCDTTPEISPEVKAKALESFRTYIMDAEEQDTFNILNDFRAAYGMFIQKMKNKGYRNAGVGIYESCLSDFYNESADNTLQVREDAIEFIRGLSVN